MAFSSFVLRPCSKSLIFICFLMVVNRTHLGLPTFHSPWAPLHVSFGKKKDMKSERCLLLRNPPKLLHVRSYVFSLSLAIRNLAFMSSPEEGRPLRSAHVPLNILPQSTIFTNIRWSCSSSFIVRYDLFFMPRDLSPFYF